MRSEEMTQEEMDLLIADLEIASQIERENHLKRKKDRETSKSKPSVGMWMSLLNLVLG